MIERLAYFIEFEKISVRAFEQKIGTSNGLIRKAISNNTDIQSKWIKAIIENFPQLNIEWLITGKGSMLKEYLDTLPLASDPQIQYSKQDDEIKYLKKIIENQQKELENKQRIIDKQLNTIEAYEKGKVAKVAGDADIHAPKKGVG